MTDQNSDLEWWKTGVVYQIYPRSFQDTTGNGVGDLNGITERVGYLADTLGVDAIWISPFYPSPMADFGYDVSDYTDVHPMFGTLDDFDRLLAEAHRRCLRVIIDWVPNHTSDQHPWFIESRSSLTNPKRDWYVWRDSKLDGSLPNNWQSEFGVRHGPATRAPVSGISTPSSQNSPISTGATPRSPLRCSARCGSGSIGALTVSA